MNPWILPLLFGGLMFVIGFFLAYRSQQTVKEFDDARKRLVDERDEARAALSAKPTPKKIASEPSVKESASSSEHEDALRQQLQDTKDKLDKQRQRAHDITRERDDLRDKLSKAEAKKPKGMNQNALVDLRMELADAKAQVEQYRSQINQLESSLEDTQSTVPHRKEPIEALAPVETPRASSEQEEDGEQSAHLRNQLQARDEELRRIEASLKKKLSRSGREAERHRRPR